MITPSSYSLGYDLDDDLQVALVPKVTVYLKHERKPFTHYQDRYTWVHGVLKNNGYLTEHDYTQLGFHN
jgi:hypothetical protein